MSCSLRYSIPESNTDWLYGVYLPFSTVLKLYITVASTSIHAFLHNILSKPLADFPHDHCRKNGQWRERYESCLNDLSSILGKNIDRAGDWTSDLLFSSLRHYRLSYMYWARLESNITTDWLNQMVYFQIKRIRIRQIDCQVFNAVLIIIPDISLQPVRISMLSWSSFYHYTIQIFFPSH